MKTIAAAGACWDVSTPTRSAEFISKYKSLNKNLANLMLLAFTEAQLKEMTQSKMIYELPVKQPQYNQWRGWGDYEPFRAMEPMKL